MLLFACASHALTAGRAWTPTETLGWSQGPIIASPRLELDSQGVPYLFARAWAGGSVYDCLGFVWNGTGWVRTWQVGRGLNFSWPVWAPPGEFYVIGQDPVPDVENKSWFYLAHKVGESFEIENITRSRSYCTDYSAAVSARRRWAFFNEQGTSALRLFYSDQFGIWTQVPISGKGGLNVTIAALDDTTAILAWGSTSGLWWGILRGSVLTVDPTPLGPPLYNTPAFRAKPSGGYWFGNATYSPTVSVRSYQDGLWGTPQTITGIYRPPWRPDLVNSGCLEMSRDPSEYPAVAWSAFNSLRDRDCVMVSVPTDDGWTVADELDNDDDGILPALARDYNGDVWVAFWRYSMNGVFWSHTYTRATSSVPVVFAQDAGQLVAWTLSEPAPETWWAVLRQTADGSYSQIARVRAGSSTAISWLDISPPGGIPRYRIRRECLDTRFQWLSDPSDGAVPALVALVGVEARAGEVRLTWYCKEAGGAQVWRRTVESEWVELGPAKAEGDGVLKYVDSRLAAGRYAYRLRMGEETTPEVWVDVPTGFALALAGFRPNPAVGSLQIAFTLADDSAAAVEVFAVNGRRVLAREVGSLGAGDHVLDVAREMALQPGVYWIRLTQAGTSLTRKGVLAN
jgi:hypothetical protein